jgi:SAM-dependent methyltransferase
MQDTMTATLRVYRWPSQAFWRYFEVQVLRGISCERPILEIGCGDGRFSSLVFEEIDEAIDVNPRSVERCRQVSKHLYRNLRCLDARELDLRDGGFSTVYANCVLEHVPQISDVLAGCFRGLRSGGKLVITVPLLRMNEHLLLPWGWYAKLRQRQLSHINLFSEEDWEKALQYAGFSQIEFRPYLSGRACRFWDAIDSPGCIGFGRYRMAAALGMVATALLPIRVKNWLLTYLSTWLSTKADAYVDKNSPCAALVIAHKAI